MTENDLLAAVRDESAAFAFSDVLAMIDRHYHFTATHFRNGNQDNPAGTNSGSCRVFAFAKKHALNETETLRLFAEHYRDVLSDPAGDNHNNIRQFMQHGWDEIQFSGEPLAAK